MAGAPRNLHGFLIKLGARRGCELKDRSVPQRASTLRSSALLWCSAWVPDVQCASPTTLLRCPTCALRLPLEAAGKGCSECRRVGLAIDGIPVLAGDPRAMRDDWGTQLREFSTETQTTRDKVLAQLAGQDLHPRTRARLERVHDALGQHQRWIEALFEGAGIEPRAAAPDTAARVPGEGVVTAYFDQVHRDWGWHEDTEEITTALEVVLEVVGDQRPRRMLVLGAGGCRLPYELHRALGVETTVAVDVNPLPFFVARRVIAGQSLPMFEFPLSPRHSEHAAVRRELRCPSPGAAGFCLLFADGLCPPVATGAFDAVFTPWFIDQVPPDMRDLLPEIHRCLAPDGVWINHGPLLYHPVHTMPTHRYRDDEVLALVAEAGFEVERHRWDRLLYMQSPAGSQGRTEGVLSFLARRSQPPEAKERARARPAWLDDPSLAVERWPALERYQAPHPMFAAVATLIDGQRSATQIAQQMTLRFNLPEASALGGVLTCLAEMWRAGHPQ